jgi:hypothetical protein
LLALKVDGWDVINFPFRYNDDDIYELIKRNKKLRITNQDKTIHKELKTDLVQRKFITLIYRFLIV